MACTIVPNGGRCRSHPTRTAAAKNSSLATGSPVALAFGADLGRAMVSCSAVTPSRRPEPRKQPQQERSRVLYDALLVAGAEMLERHGPDFTLSDVAERAGVSPGSLYQYFPDRRALVGALIDRQIASDRASLADFRRASSAPGTEPVSELLADGVLRLYGQRPALLSSMVQLLRELGREGDVQAVVSDFCAALSERLGAECPECDDEACRDAALAAVSGVLGVVRETARTQPEKLATPGFRARLVAIAAAALRPTAPWPRPE